MIFIPLCKLDEHLKNAAIDFVKKRECSSVQISSSIINGKSKDIYAVFVSKICIEQIYGVLILGKTILHCLPFSNPEKQTALQESFVSSLKEFYLENELRLPFCVNGEKNGTFTILKTLSLLDAKPSEINEYNLLRLDAKSFLTLKPFKLNHDEIYIRCKKNLPENLFESLFSLQKNYEIEEVVPSCFSFNEDLCRLKLKNSMRKQCVLALETQDEKIVSKVQSSAIGFRFVQIGGVYTLPSHRRKHYGFNLMILLCRKILKSGKIPVLFVKTKNKKACALYEKLEFKKASDYIIAYFSYNQ